jgi:hypothetical protein
MIRLLSPTERRRGPRWLQQIIVKLLKKAA